MKATLQNISKAFGGRELFQDYTLELNSGMRLAVVGPNGAGKTTLLKIMAGKASADSGRVILPKGARVGYVAQELSSEDLERSLLDWVLEVLPSWREFWREWEAAQEQGDQTALNRLATRQAELEQMFGYNPEHRAHTVLSGLGFEVEVHGNTLATFSGGWRERAKLARVLVAGADLLLLDEPTNHLDLEAIQWLEEFLLGYAGVLVFVAHDRVFLNTISSHVLYLGGSKPLLRQGDFDDFLAWQEEMEEQRRRETKKLTREIEKKMDFVRRFKAKATKARQAQSKKKQAERLEKELEGHVPEPRRKSLSFSWPEPLRGDKTVCSVVDLSVSFDDKALWPPLNFSIYRGQRVALAGPNGSGKSTLLKALLGKQAMTGRAELSSNTAVGYFSQHQTEILDVQRPVLAEVRRLSDPRTSEEELMSVLGRFMLGAGYFDRLVGSLSGGEKNRLVLASLFLARANFLVLDEPTNHLDMESREALVESLEEFPGTILMVAHDRWLLARVAEQVWALSPQGMTVHEDGFEGYLRAMRDQAEQDKVRPGGDEEDGAQPKAKLDREAAKQRKRELAEQRNALYRELKPRKETLAKLEKELESVLDELSSMEKTLADPEVYADSGKMNGLLKEYNALQTRSEKLMEKMDPLEREIAEMESRREELTSE